MRDLDEFDKSLLRLLQQNNRLTIDELSKEINLSQSAIQRRLTRFRDEKIIEADVSIVSQEVAGIGITCVVDVILNEGNSKAIDAFKKAMLKCPEVSLCFYVTGTYDFVLIVNTKDMSHFEDFQKIKLMDSPHLKHFYTHVVMDKVKLNFGVVI